MQTTKIFSGKYLDTKKNLTVVFDHGPPVIIPSSNDRYQKILDLINMRMWDDVPSAVDKALSIRKTSKGKFTVVNGSILIDGVELPESLSNKLIDLVDSGEDTSRLEHFWDNLAQNPTDSAREDLYDFLMMNNVPITRDGCFIVYKKVRDDFWDSYSGCTFHCVPGSVIEMEREKVDHNRQNTCSAGLHVAAWEYAQGFSGTRLVECKVNPRDVVAVPPDYSQRKMRVCKAEILCEATEKYTESAYNHDTDDGRLVQQDISALIEPDSEGRLRIPGKLIRLLGIGVDCQVEVVLEEDGDDFLLVRPIELEKGCLDAYWAIYTVREDNSVRISPSVLEWAGLDNNAVEVSFESSRLMLMLP